ncbi:hypothetical protein JW796_04720 [Candidatus Dojkabacteria bacterium]|nr:hypothetical protein [Candidatus Dojkabacteria bacterium]
MKISSIKKVFQQHNWFEVIKKPEKIFKPKERIYFILLSLLIVAPLLKPGFVLTLDMIFTPNMTFQIPPVSGLYSFVPLDTALFLLAKIIPADILQKIFLLVLFYLIPTGFFKFLSIFKKEKKDLFLRLLTSTLYLWNPFVYSRLMAGQWTLLFGYALLPLFIYHLVKSYKSRNTGETFNRDFWENILYSTLLSLIITIFSPHHLAFILLIFLVYSFIKIISRTKGGVKKILILALAQILIHSLWIIPTLISGKAKITFGEKDLLVFASSPDSSLGTFLNLFTMYGFWAEKTLFYLPKLIIPFWPLPFFILILPIIFLFFTYLPEKIRRIFALQKEPFKKNRDIILTSFLIALIGLVLSLGSMGIAKPVFDFFYLKLGLLNPFREPQKFLSLYIFGFCTLFFPGMKIWVSQIRNEHLKSLEQFKKRESEKIRRILEKAIIFGFFVLIFSLTCTLFWGTAGQLKTAYYPQSYTELDRLTKGTDSKILVLPFKSYDFFPFNNRRIANPAPKYFNAEVFSDEKLVEISGTNCDAYISSTNSCLKKSDSVEVWTDVIKKSGIDYILVNKNSDFRSYSFLEDRNYSKKILEDDYAYVLELSAE